MTRHRFSWTPTSFLLCGDREGVVTGAQPERSPGDAGDVSAMLTNAPRRGDQTAALAV
jgi:hypothetical protein